MVRIARCLPDTRGKLAPQIMEAQSRDVGATAGSIPSCFDARDLLPYLVAEHVGVRAELMAVRRYATHFQNRGEPLSHRDLARLVGLRLLSREHDPARDRLPFQPARVFDIPPLQRQQLADPAAGFKSRDD